MTDEPMHPHVRRVLNSYDDSALTEILRQRGYLVVKPGEGVSYFVETPNGSLRLARLPDLSTPGEERSTESMLHRASRSVSASPVPDSREALQVRINDERAGYLAAPAAAPVDVPTEALTLERAQMIGRMAKEAEGCEDCAGSGIVWIDDVDDSAGWPATCGACTYCPDHFPKPAAASAPSIQGLVGHVAEALMEHSAVSLNMCSCGSVYDAPRLRHLAEVAVAAVRSFAEVVSPSSTEAPTEP